MPLMGQTPPFARVAARTWQGEGESERERERD